MKFLRFGRVPGGHGRGEELRGKHIHARQGLWLADTLLEPRKNP
jgi:hypothetical protein